MYRKMEKVLSLELFENLTDIDVTRFTEIMFRIFPYAVKISTIDESIPCIPVSDMPDVGIMCVLSLGHDLAGNQLYVYVNDDLMDCWDIELADLFKLAENNMKLYPELPVTESTKKILAKRIMAQRMIMRKPV